MLTRGLQSGSRAAVAGAAGCATGAFVYVTATAAGLAASQIVFAAVRYAGAAYLCRLGFTALRSRAPESPRTAVLLLDAIFVSLGFASDSLYAFGSGRLRALLLRRSRLRLRKNRATGVLYLGLGGWAAVSGSDQEPLIRRV